MKDIQTIFFDFDGVILESVDIKGWAFGKLFEDAPEYVDEIVAFHYADGGMSRFDKFRYIYKNILRKPLPHKKFEKLCEDFAGLVYNRVLECEFVPGAKKFLQKYYKKIPLYIISGTPQEEIVNIVKAKRLDPYFKDVFGAPTTKGQWAKRIIDERDLDPTEVIFIGDAISDYRAAKENGLFFIARVKNLANNPFNDKKIDFKINDLFELNRFIAYNGLIR